MRALLDINVWIALFDDAHQFSDRANLFIAKQGVKIATCPLVENGVIRVMSSPHYSRRGAPTIQQVRERLHQACSELDHVFCLTMSLCVTTNSSTSRGFRGTTRSRTCTCWRWPCATRAACSASTKALRYPACTVLRKSTC